MAIADAFHFGLKGGSVAVWNGINVYGTPLAIKVNNASVELRTVNGELELNDRIEDVHAKIIAATVSCRFGFENLQAYEIFTGITRADSTPDSESLVIGENNMPYLAMSFRVDWTSGAGALYLFFPKLKAVQGFTLSPSYGQFVTPEMQLTAVYESALYGMGKFIRKTTATAVTVPQS